MRRISVSVFALLFALPASAGTRLPVVNLAAGSVSARAAFGEEIIQTPKQIAKADLASHVDVATPTKAPEKKVVTRAAKKAATAKTVANGDEIIARTDVLTPRRPSADLWAKSDASLRIPTPDEFSVFRSDAELPEEDLNSAFAAVEKDASINDLRARATDLDSQISKLVELQRRADESVRATTRSTSSQKIALDSAAGHVDSIAAVRAQKPAADDVADSSPVQLSRMVVPMAPDVVVRTVEKNTAPRIAAARDDMNSMSPTELRKAFRKTFLSENKHLSTFQIDDRFDVASDMTASVEGFTARRDLSESAGIRPLEIKIRFRDDDAALSRDNYNLLSEYASIVVSNPKRAIQVSIPQAATRNTDARKLAARRLAIVEQVLRDTGVSEQRIMPVLSQRDEDGFVLRVISNDQYETLTKKQRDMFGDTTSKKTYKSMSW